MPYEYVYAEQFQLLDAPGLTSERSTVQSGSGEEEEEQEEEDESITTPST